MNLKKISNEELIHRLKRLAQTERKITHLVLVHINEVKERRLYADLGYSSLFEYLTKSLGYSESSAYRRIKSAELLKALPEVAEKIEQGKINLSQLTELQKAIKTTKEKLKHDLYKEKVENDLNHENSELAQERINHLSLNQKLDLQLKTQSLIQKLENKNSFETKQIISQELDLPLQIQEKVQPQRDESVTITLNLSKSEYEELKQAQSLLSHICHSGNLNEVITYLAQSFNKKKLGKEVNVLREGKVNSAQEMNQRSSKENPAPSSLEHQNLTQSFAAAAVTSELKNEKKSEGEVTISVQKELQIEAMDAKSVVSKRKRRYISIHTMRELLRKSQLSCQYQDPSTQHTCHSTYQLQLDHITPHSLGGNDSKTNLRVLCRTHNLLAAKHAGVGV